MIYKIIYDWITGKRKLKKLWIKEQKILKKTRVRLLIDACQSEGLENMNEISCLLKMGADPYSSLNEYGYRLTAMEVANIYSKEKKFLMMNYLLDIQKSKEKSK